MMWGHILYIPTFSPTLLLIAFTKRVTMKLVISKMSGPIAILVCVIKITTLVSGKLGKTFT